MKEKAKSQLNTSTVIGMDLISWCTGVIPAVLSWSVIFECFYFSAVYRGSGFYRMAMVILAPLLGALALSGACFLLRLIFPRLKEGVYRANLNRGMIAWYLNLGLSRSAEISGLKALIQSFYVLKYLHWRALGAQVEFGFHSSIGVSLVDLPLLSIGKGCTLAEGVHISAHTFVGDRLLLKRVKIGRNAFVGMHTIIGAKTEIGDGCWIGMYNLIAGERLPSETRIKDFERFRPLNASSS